MEKAVTPRIQAPDVETTRLVSGRRFLATIEGWVSCPDDGYCLQYIPWHLLEANEKIELHSLLFDPVWLRRKLKTLGVNAFD
jgi:hypothetical protein